MNLAWKIADVVQGRADASLLDSYQPERIAFAQRLVASTDRAFTGVTSDGAIARRIRLNVVPAVAPAVFSFRVVRRFMFRTISQISVHYRNSSLSEGRAGDVHGGDRLPWVPPLHVFPWRPAMGRAGLQRNAVYLIRPDGYVAFADAGGRGAAITSYLDARKFVASPRRSVQS